jgi:hypothetical protein
MLTCRASRRIRAVRFHSLSFLCVLAACAAQPPSESPPEVVREPARPGPVVAPDPAVGQAAPDGIKEVALDRTRVCPGESLHVDVVARGPGYGFAIDGMETESRTLQLAGAPGKRIVRVDSWPLADRGAISGRDVEVELRADCPASAVARPIIEARPSLTEPRRVELSVTHAGATHVQRYEWHFGDGSPPEVTSVPALNHLYRLEALSFQRNASLFDVRVVAHGPAGSAEGVRTLALHTPYARRKAQGVLQPPLAGAPHWDAEARRVSVTLFNPEPYPLALGALDVTFEACDGTRDPVQSAPVAIDVVVPAAASVSFGHTLPEAPAGTCGAALRAHGAAGTEAPEPLEVEVPFHVELARSPARTRPVDDATARALDALEARGLLSPQHAIRDDELALLVRAGVVPRRLLPPASAPLAWLSTPAPVEECAPGTAELPPHPGWVCSPTSRWVRDEPYIANAHVGDLVLSTTCTEIGTMLRALEVPQTFSHVGIMIQHYDALRHATAVTKRFEDNRAGTVGAQGVVPEVLRFAMPGTITATIDQAYHGMVWHDARGGGKDYRVAGFDEDGARCSGDADVIYPLVITGPLASLEKRKRIARAALAIDAHYRFYAYTEADIALDAEYDMPSVFGGRVVGAQCSSFVWAAARSAGIALEGALEPRDMTLGAKTQAGILDGLYFYTAAERTAAAARLHANIFNQVSADGGFLAGVVGAPGHWANQITNCFAADGCALSNKDSTAWKNVRTTGRTVSPADMLFWDDPYGRSEPIAYRVGTFRKVYTWQPPHGAGTLRVLVRDAQGAAVSGATVTVGGLMRSTGASGEVTFQPDASTVDVLAVKRIGGVLFAGQGSVAVLANTTTAITVTLGPPPASLRSVRIEGTLKVVDDELFGRDPSRTLSVGEDVLVNPSAREKRVRLSVCAGNEARADVSLTLTLEDNWSVDVAGTMKLYEGASCNTTDQEDASSTTVNVLAGGQRTFHIDTRSSGAGGGDRAGLDVVIRNDPAR